MSTTFRSRQLAPHGTDDRAFGLIEVVVALALLMMTMIPMGYLLTSIAQQSATVRQKVAATGLAEQLLSQYNTLPLAQLLAKAGGLPATVPAPDQTLGGAVYHSQVQLQWAETGLNGNLCQPGSTPQVISAIAKVWWGAGATSATTTDEVQEQTVINPPYGYLQSGQGFLAVQVDDAAGNPLVTPAGLSVNATVTPDPFTGTGSDTLLVPSNPVTPLNSGCIFISALNLTYTVKLHGSTGSPYQFVDNHETPIPSSPSLQVRTGVTASATMVYDEGGAMSLTYSSTASLSGGFACPTATDCFGWGRGSSGADVVHFASSGTFSLLNLPTGVTSITGVSCESSACYFAGIGSTSTGAATGVLLEDQGGTVTSVPLAVPSTALTAVACLNNSTCYATGTDADTSGVLVSISAGTTANALPVVTSLTITTLTSIECSNSNNCIATGSGTITPTTGAATPTAVVLTTSGQTWLPSPVPASATAASTIACDPFSGTNPPICVVAVQAGGPNIMSTTNDGATWAMATSFPTGVTDIGPIACTGSSSCVAAIQSVSATATSATTITTTDGQNWSVTPSPGPGLPPDLEAVTGMTCPASGKCLISGVGASGSGVALSNNGGSTWTIQFPGETSFLSGVGCLSASTCGVVGEAPTGPTAFMTANGGSSWAPASGASGFASLAWSPQPVTGLPITVANGLIPNGGVYQPVLYSSASSTDPTLIPNLFPFSMAKAQPAYAAWAGDQQCLNEVPNSVDLAPILVTAGTTTPATIPQVLLGISVNRPNNGTPVNGASVSLAVAGSNCANDAFGVPSTGTDGVVAVGIPTGVTVSGVAMTYVITVTDAGQSTSATITIDPTGITNSTTGVTYPDPTPVPFVLNVP
jgi:hypothetical protein